MQENIVEAVRDLQREIGFGNAEKGFHEEGIDTIARYADVTSPEWQGSDHYKKAGVQDYRRYAAQRIMLVVTELAEAFEEVRDGRSMTETWYSNKRAPGVVFTRSAEGAWEYSDEEGEGEINPDFIPGMKPEGVPSELADVLIRVLDIGDEFGIDLAAMVQEKLAYNASRPKMHGRQF